MDALGGPVRSLNPFGRAGVPRGVRAPQAQKLFEQLMQRHPHRLEGMDTYSNILYVKECKAELSFLAHRAVRNDK